MDGFFNKELGFSLIELIIIIILVGILGVYATEKFPGSVVNLDAQAQELSNDIRFAQSLSMTKGQRYRFVKLSSTTYQILNAAGSAVILGTGNNIITLNTGITFGTLSNLPNSLVAFDGNGTPYVDTALPGTTLTASASIPMTDGVNTKTVLISPETGRVSIQ